MQAWPAVETGKVGLFKARREGFGWQCYYGFLRAKVGMCSSKRRKGAAHVFGDAMRSKEAAEDGLKTLDGTGAAPRPRVHRWWVGGRRRVGRAGKEGGRVRSRRSRAPQACMPAAKLRVSNLTPGAGGEAGRPVEKKECCEGSPRQNLAKRGGRVAKHES